MNYWLTTHWPPLQDEPDDPPSDIFLRDEYKTAGSDLQRGDHVLIFQTQTGKSVLKPGPSGTDRVVKRRKGVRGILAIGEVLSPLQESNSPERYDDGVTRWWRWRARTRAVSRGGFVPWRTVNQILGYQENYTMRGFGGGAGLKKISPQQYDEFVAFFNKGGESLANTPKERYVVDEDGNRVAVLLDAKHYYKLLEELEELESIRAYEAAKASGEEAIPFEQAVTEIEQDR